MEAAGLRDILLSFPLVGAAKAERLAALAREVDAVGRRRLGRRRARALAGARRARARGRLPRRAATRGFARTGVQTPEEAADLAELVDSLPGPALRRPDDLPDDRRRPAPGCARAIDAIEARGLEVRGSARGGTPTFFTNHEVPEITEVRAGHVRLRRPHVHRERHRARSRTARCASARRSSAGRRADRGILDCGSKTLTNDPAEDRGAAAVTG